MACTRVACTVPTCKCSSLVGISMHIQVLWHEKFVMFLYPFCGYWARLERAERESERARAPHVVVLTSEVTDRVIEN